MWTDGLSGNEAVLRFCYGREYRLGSDRGRYESDPIYDVLLQITVERYVWPLPYVPSYGRKFYGRKLALAFLAAKE